MKLSRTDGLGGVEQLNGLQDLFIWRHLIFLWGFLKERVYKTKPASVEELKQKITDKISLITVDMLRNVRNSFQLRLALKRWKEDNLNIW